MSKKFDKLVKLLQTLFQLDQPELDFGLYRIMHTRAEEIKNFLERDLLAAVEEVFGKSEQEQIEKLQHEYDAAVQMAEDFGAPNPHASPKVIAVLDKINAAKNRGSAEDEVYNHLYHFFERYYDGGDFMSLRYLTRETSDKANAYAIPYDGSEVKLHWANADQYYIKTTEYFNHYSFKLKPDNAENPLRVHFRIVEADEGEHNNVKESSDKKRFFVADKQNPITIENGEICIRFHYKNDPEKTGQDSGWQKAKNDESIEIIRQKIEEFEGIAEYKSALFAAAPTDKEKDRIVLAKHLTGYTARNTMDYFIHKDLGGFLRRELDFYIKNEIMRLDDIENADAPKVEEYLGKIKLFRSIARKIIAFLAQIENFQKKLWLKKKFVFETNYCITLDRVPEELYPEIISNERQREEWVRLFAIDEIQAEENGIFAAGAAYSVPLSSDFLRENKYLVLDTAFFGEEFKQRLIASIHDFDEQCDGLLIHSENFQALNLLQQRYKEQVKCIYIDPPYNTGKDGFAYKDNYQHSSWISMINDRISISDKLKLSTSVSLISLDDNEQSQLKLLCDEIFGSNNFAGQIIIETATDNNPRQISIEHEYMLCYCSNLSLQDPWIARSEKAEMIQTKYFDLKNLYNNNIELIQSELRKWINTNKSKLESVDHYDNVDEMGVYHDGDVANTKFGGYKYNILHPITKKYCKIPEKGFRFPETTMLSLISKGDIEFGKDETTLIKPKKRLENVKDRLRSVIYEDGRASTKMLEQIFFKDIFKNPKSFQIIKRIISFTTDTSSLILDYFAGSGTTGHAVINLNRDGGSRKYILVEMGDYFDTVTKPRIEKVIYSKDWKNGKPTERNTGVSHCFKYIRLESYEDTLNNLELKRSAAQEALFSMDEAKPLKEEYLLNYMLEVETRGNAGLLNIDMFAEPMQYKLKIKRPGTDEYEWRNVDLIETFNYLIGLRLVSMNCVERFSADFKRVPDADLPKDYNTRLLIDGKLRSDKSGKWWIRKIEGWVPDASNGREKVLIIWRNLTDDIEQDNLVLDTWFSKQCLSTQDMEFDMIYVNGTNNLPNLLREGDNWKVRQTEYEFKRLMWDGDGK